jgi:hypothetical protein
MFVGNSVSEAETKKCAGSGMRLAFLFVVWQDAGPTAERSGSSDTCFIATHSGLYKSGSYSAKRPLQTRPGLWLYTPDIHSTKKFMVRSSISLWILRQSLYQLAYNQLSAIKFSDESKKEEGNHRKYFSWF